MWTALQHDGPNHLGLWSGLPSSVPLGAQAAHLQNGLVALQGVMSTMKESMAAMQKQLDEIA